MTKGVARGIDQLLQPLGFRKREGAWNRKVGDLVEVVSMQLDMSDRTLTVEAGVLHPVAYTKCWEEPVPEFVDAPDCTIRTRVQDRPYDRARWWSLDEPGIAADIVSRISSDLLPFVEGNHSDEAIERTLAASKAVKYLTPPETVYLAILRHKRGDTDGACTLLRRFRERVLGEWKPKAEKLMTQLGCESQDAVHGRRQKGDTSRF